jgi:hypothetical protein
MAILVCMATTTHGDQPFSRIVETRKTTSWSVGVPIAIFVVIAVALIAYFAAKNTQAREQLAQAEQSSQQNQQALSQLQQKVASTDAEISRLRDAGRTTVILQGAGAAKRGKAGTGAWGAATWGEQPDGKSWLRLNAYGLAPAPAGKTYDLWFVSATGDSIQVGKLDPNTDGSAYLEGRDLPGVDKGKSVLVSVDDENAKAPGQPLFQAALPKLTPTQHAAAPSSGQEQAQEQSGTQSDTAQGRRAPPQKR